MKTAVCSIAAACALCADAAEFVSGRVTKSGKGFCLYNWSPYAFGFTSLNE